MLDMGFIPDVEKIVSLLPRRRQTLFFSATMAPEIRRLADAFLNDPKEITVSPPASASATVSQHAIVVDERMKSEVLRRLLRTEEVKNAIIFCNRKIDVAQVQKSLASHGFDALPLHGDMTQAARTETLDRFRRNELTLLIASDVAARGLDIADLSHVFNYDVPVSPEDYVHRIGRTGRAGKTGRAFTLVMPDEARSLAQIETLIGTQIPRVAAPDMELVELLPDDGTKRRRGGKRAAPVPQRERGGKAARPAPAAPPAASVEAPVEMAAEQPAIVEIAPAQPRPSRPRRERPERHQHSAEIRELRPPPVTRREDEPAMIGLGDHVPAFLLRSPRKADKTA